MLLRASELKTESSAFNPELHVGLEYLFTSDELCTYSISMLTSCQCPAWWYQTCVHSTGITHLQKKWHRIMFQTHHNKYQGCQEAKAATASKYQDANPEVRAGSYQIMLNHKGGALPYHTVSWHWREHWISQEAINTCIDIYRLKPRALSHQRQLNMPLLEPMSFDNLCTINITSDSVNNHSSPESLPGHPHPCPSPWQYTFCRERNSHGHVHVIQYWTR